ncbi:MAG: hypothetical protein K2M64_03410 [Clostridia bacterium]|nr:hypothetical protein [Clostridia bacterium]
MTKLNNSRILLAILLLAIFIIFCSLTIALAVKPYFCNLDYVGVYKSNEYGYTRKIKMTIKFEEYGRYKVTQTNTYDGLRNETYSATGTYEYTDMYEDQYYFKLDDSWSNFYCNNAFQLEYSDVVFTNIGAICLLIFYLLASIGSLSGAIVLLVKHKNGKKVFYDIARMQAQIDELNKQIDELKKGE